jgi:hypothetical protein
MCSLAGRRASREGFNYAFLFFFLATWLDVQRSPLSAVSDKKVGEAREASHPKSPFFLTITSPFCPAWSSRKSPPLTLSLSAPPFPLAPSNSLPPLSSD